MSMPIASLPEDEQSTSVGRKSVAEPIGPLRDLQTRFLYPFFFERNQVAQAAAALLDQTCAHRDGRGQALWHCERPSFLYCDELLDHARDFLFGKTDEPAGVETTLSANSTVSNRTDADTSLCRYLKISADTVHAWFRQTSLQFNAAKDKPSAAAADSDDSTGERQKLFGVALVPNARIEVFLSAYGVGVVSVALTPASDHLTAADASDFNYRLAQFRRHDLAKIRKSHPSDDEATWNRIPTEAKNKIKPAPAATAPLAERLGVPGGGFDLSELLAWLLRPLAPFGMRAIQNELSIYTVARFGSDVDFESPDRRERYGVFLAGLTQVEESRHAGAAADALGVANERLNRLHWVAVGQLGAAHLIADQAMPGDRDSANDGEGSELSDTGSGARDHSFSGSKTVIVRDKYFVPYLVALLQRLVLNRVIRESMHDPENLASLRGDILRFAVQGHFTQVSSRHALDRFYRVARDGMNVQDAWTEVRRAVSDLDAKNAAGRQEKLAGSMAENLRVIAHVQTMVEYIEIFMVSAYAAHMFNMLFEGNGHAQLVAHLPWLGQALSEWLRSHVEEFRTAGTAITAIIAGFATWLLVRPKRQHGPD
jgi:hypothetical protein